MTDRNRMKERIVAALSSCGAVDESTAMTLWTLSSKLMDESEGVSIRYVRRMLEVLWAEGRIMQDSDGDRCAHDEPTRFWMRSEAAMSDPCESVQPMRNSVREAHEHEEMQLPSVDPDDGAADLGSDG